MNKILRFREYIRVIAEGANGKYKVGNEPEFKYNGHKKIAEAIKAFVKKNPSAIREIHYPKDSKKATYDSKNKFTLAVTDLEVLMDLKGYLESKKFEITSKGHDFTVTADGNSFLIRLSSGRGFFFEDEVSRTIPSTEEQETGTIEFIKFYIKHGEYPNIDEISKIVGFDFDEMFYKSFVFQTNALKDFVGNLKGYEIDLDSDKDSIRHKLFKLKGLRDVKMSNKDNWNPADIWLYKNDTEVIKALKDCETLAEFNEKFKELFVTKQLIGVSLKKALKPAKVKVIDISATPRFDLDFDKTVMNLENTYWDIKTKGYPEKFMIRARAKAKSISSPKDIKIYFEGKIENSTEFLGAIEKRKISSLPGAGDKYNGEISVEIVKNLIKEVENMGYMKFTNLEHLNEADSLRLLYLYILIRYAKAIYSAGRETLIQIAYAGYKMNDYSSIHLKIGG